MEAPSQAPEGGEEDHRGEEVAPRAAREIRSRRAVAAALAAVDAMGDGRPLRLALSEALGEATGLGPRERRHVAVAARGVARWLRACDAALVRAGAPRSIPADRALLRYLAWRVAVLGEPGSGVLRDLRLPGPRRPRAISDGSLTEVAGRLPRVGPGRWPWRDAAGAPLPVPADPVVALGLRGSVPDAFARRLLRDLPAGEAVACLAAMNREPELALRVNVARAGRREVLAALRASGIDVAAGEGPWAVRVADRAGLFDATPLREGLAEVQDESSQAAVRACRARRGERWLDLCAGSGGKSLALAALGVRVTAWDASRRRLEELPRRARRARVRLEVARREPDGAFDGVLVDAPCSGSGALAREPDARWRIDDAWVDRFAKLQGELLERAAALVRAGGSLVYATCSLFREEGEEVVERFLARASGFRKVSESRRWPHREAGAGFYVARLRAADRRARGGRRPA